MKAAAFDYECARTVEEAVSLLNGTPGARVIAGSQTLGPMLNLRLVQPPLLVDITRIPDLCGVTETATSVTFGACVTHANIEDGRVPDPTGGFLARIAGGIAYRGVRTRGTIGGSLAHADPAADWVSALTVLDVEIDIQGADGPRTVHYNDFIRGALSTALEPGEILVAIRIPKPPTRTRLGYSKICRKTGEFARAIGVVRSDDGGSKVRLAAGANGGVPILIQNGFDFINMDQIDRQSVGDILVANGVKDEPYERAIRVSVLQRALSSSLAS